MSNIHLWSPPIREHFSYAITCPKYGNFRNQSTSIVGTCCEPDRPQVSCHLTRGLLRCISYWLELLDPLNSDILLIRCRRLPMVNSVSVEGGMVQTCFRYRPPKVVLRQAFGCGRLHCSLNLWQYRLISKAPCKRTQHCWMWHVASVCTPCCMLLGVVAQSLKQVKRLATCKRTQ